AWIGLCLAKPRFQRGANTVEDRPNRAGARPHEVDVFRVAQRCGEMQLVERRAAPKAQFAPQERIGEYSDKRAADDEVLLDLPLAYPRCDAAPGGDIVLRDHSSISGGRR